MNTTATYPTRLSEPTWSETMTAAKQAAKADDWKMATAYFRHAEAMVYVAENGGRSVGNTVARQHCKDLTAACNEAESWDYIARRNPKSIQAHQNAIQAREAARDLIGLNNSWG